MWTEHGSVMKYTSRLWKLRIKNPPLAAHVPKKILMLDLDGTIITPASGQKFPKDADDWKWRFDVVQSLLQKYSKTCYIVIVSNQAGLTLKRRKNRKGEKENFKTKIDTIVKELQIPVLAFACTAKDVYRKPSPLVFEEFISSPKNGISINRITHIMYVGDAAGRDATSANTLVLKDFSDSDRKFASNIALNIKTFGLGSKDDSVETRVSFKTPEEFFLKHTKINPLPYTGFDPQQFLDSYKSDPKTWDILSDLEPFDESVLPKNTIGSPKNELILLIGPQGSGKSKIAKTITQRWSTYVSFSQDDHKTKTPRLVKEALEAGDSVVVDNTHYTISQRAKYISIVEKLKHKPRVRVIMVLGWYGSPTTSRKFDLSKKSDRTDQIKMAKHMSMARNKANARTGWETPPKHIPDVAYNSYNAKFVYPTNSEGIHVIEQIPFVPKFKNNRDLITFLERT